MALAVRLALQLPTERADAARLRTPSPLTDTGGCGGSCCSSFAVVSCDGALAERRIRGINVVNPGVAGVLLDLPQSGSSSSKPFEHAVRDEPNTARSGMAWGGCQTDSDASVNLVMGTRVRPAAEDYSPAEETPRTEQAHLCTKSDAAHCRCRWVLRGA